MAPNERRKSKRIAAALGMEEAVMVQVNGQQYPATLENLGLGGALIDMRESASEIGAGIGCDLKPDPRQ